MNIHLILQMAAEAMGDRESITAGDQRLTYAELDQAARTIATKLKDGQRLAYLAENHPAMPAAIFGAAMAGAPFVPINYRLAEEQIDALMERVKPALLITENHKAYDVIDLINRTDCHVRRGDGRRGV